MTSAISVSSTVSICAQVAFSLWLLINTGVCHVFLHAAAGQPVVLANAMMGTTSPGAHAPVRGPPTARACGASTSPPASQHQSTGHSSPPVGTQLHARRGTTPARRAPTASLRLRKSRSATSTRIATATRPGATMGSRPVSVQCRPRLGPARSPLAKWLMLRTAGVPGLTAPKRLRTAC